MTKRIAIADLVRALAVLALVFLNFGHTSLAAASTYGGFASTADSYCGDPLDDGGKVDHAPCDACRIGGGADLPSPCPVVLSARPSVVLRYGLVASTPALVRNAGGIVARGPPAA